MKPALVLLHGWAVNSNIWNPILDRLKSKFEVTVVDLPGYGNDTDYFEDYSLDSIAEAVLDRAPAKANWVAWSLGGTVAVAAALKHPERFEKLQLISTTPRFSKCEGWAHSDVSINFFRSLKDDFNKDYGSALQRFLLLCVLSPNREQAIPMARLVREVGKEIKKSKPPYKHILQNGLKILDETDLREQIKELTVETQVIAGKNDHVIPSEASQALFDQLQNGHSFHCFDSGHLPFLQNPSKYIEVLVSFIKNSDH